jgi:hypothetical protein
MILFWLALAVATLVSVAALVITIRRGLALFRDFKRLSSEVGEKLDGIERASSEIELHLQTAATSGSALEASLTRLRASRAELAVSTAAIADVRASIDRVASFLPRSK